MKIQSTARWNADSFVEVQKLYVEKRTYKDECPRTKPVTISLFLRQQKLEMKLKHCTYKSFIHKDMTVFFFRPQFDLWRNGLNHYQTSGHYHNHAHNITVALQYRVYMIYHNCYVKYWNWVKFQSFISLCSFYMEVFEGICRSICQ